jgi:hypothetical protein
VGLDRECYPDLAIGDLPNIYPYIINDPGEGTQAKRQGHGHHHRLGRHRRCGGRLKALSVFSFKESSTL